MITKNANQNILMVGTGYVGLVTGAGLAKLGHNVACQDINPDRVALLKSGKAPFYEPQVDELMAEGVTSGRLSFYQSLKEAYTGQRYIFIGVQTPQDENGRTDLSMLRAAVTGLAETITEKAIVIVKSTVPVGIFSELEDLPAVKKSGKITFVSCPEFLAEGTAVHDFFHPRRTIVGSNDPQLSEEVAGLFHGIGGAFIVTDAKTAQMIKYSANSFLAVRVAFINDVAEICEKFGVNVNDVANALVMDPRVGGTYLWPSIGFAGPCLPKDIAALIESGERAGAPGLLLRGASEHNAAHLRHVIDEIIRYLDGGKTVAVFGLSFKPNTDDVRSAFSLRIIESLIEEGITVRATDPQAIPAVKTVFTHDQLTLHEDPYDAAKGSDVQVFLTPWIDYQALDFAKLADLVSHKQVFDGMRVVSEDDAVKHGFSYRGVGHVYGPEGRPVYEVSENPATFTEIA